MMAMRMASAGWWSGNPEAILAAPADIVMAAVQYERFKQDFERTYIELNKDKE